MALIITSYIGENRVKFKNDQITAQDKGDLTFSNVVQDGTTVTCDMEGKNVEGTAINETDVVMTIVGDWNATKIFQAVAAILKEVVCPECV